MTTARLAVIGTGCAMTVALPLSFPADDGPTGVDTAVAHAVADGVPTGIARFLVAPSDTLMVLVVQLAAILWFARHRDRWSAVTMILVPALVAAVNSWLLKPFWDRDLHGYLAYPSGHTVHLVAVAVTFACLVTSRRAAAAVIAGLAAILVPVTAGMTLLGYHHPTDVLGGAAAASSLSVLLCWAMFRVRPAPHTPPPG